MVLSSLFCLFKSEKKRIKLQDEIDSSQVCASEICWFEVRCWRNCERVVFTCFQKSAIMASQFWKSCSFLHLVCSTHCSMVIPSAIFSILFCCCFGVGVFFGFLFAKFLFLLKFNCVCNLNWILVFCHKKKKKQKNKKQNHLFFSSLVKARCCTNHNHGHLCCHCDDLDVCF